MRPVLTPSRRSQPPVMRQSRLGMIAPAQSPAPDPIATTFRAVDRQRAPDSTPYCEPSQLQLSCSFSEGYIRAHLCLQASTLLTQPRRPSTAPLGDCGLAPGAHPPARWPIYLPIVMPSRFP